MLSAFDIATLKDVKDSRAWQDSNLQSPDPKSGALSIRPHGLNCSVLQYVLTRYILSFTPGWNTWKTFSTKNLVLSQLVGFEPTLPEGNSFRVSRLNHSATTADLRPSHISTIYTCFSTLPDSCCAQSIVGSVVECSPATRAARVRFPDDADILFLF